MHHKYALLWIKHWIVILGNKGEKIKITTQLHVQLQILKNKLLLISRETTMVATNLFIIFSREAKTP